MKKVVVSFLALSLLSGAIAGKGDPIHKIPSSVMESIIFDFLESKDINSVGAVDTVFNAEVKKHINTIWKAGGSFKKFFHDPKSLAVKYIEEEGSRELKAYFMNQFLESPSADLLALWMEEAPVEMFYSILSSFIKDHLPRLFDEKYDDAGRGRILNIISRSRKFDTWDMSWYEDLSRVSKIKRGFIFM